MRGGVEPGGARGQKVSTEKKPTLLDVECGGMMDEKEGDLIQVTFLGDRGSRHLDAPQCRSASKFRQNAGQSHAVWLLPVQTAYLVHYYLDILMLGAVLVGPCIRMELSCKEDFLTLREKVPRDGLLVVVKLLLEDDTAEESGCLAVLAEVLREGKPCESLSFVRCHVCCESA